MTEGWTPGRKHGFIVNTLRWGSRKWPAKFKTLEEAKTEKKINPASGRLAQFYLCNRCKKEYTNKDVEVNHIQAVVDPVEGFVSWDEYIARMFCDKSNYEVLCTTCHKAITQKENQIRKYYETKAHKPTYGSWWKMVDRCKNINSERFYTHGGRGIDVCPEWQEDYENFLKDMGPRPEGYTLDRIDNNKGYYKENCRWATPKEQALNRRTNIYVEHNGVSKSISEWAEEIGITFSAMKKRLLHWEIEKALSSEIFEVEDVPEDTKKEILEMYESTGLSQSKLAKMYGVSQAAISKWNIKRKKETSESN